MLTQIAATIVQNLSRPDKALSVTVDGDQLDLPSQSATALALATNELIQNALDHAFVGRDEGTVLVQLRDEGEMLVIAVIDDGVGLACGDASDETSLGLEIVKTLVTEDLQGTFCLAPGERGTEATIRLPRPSSQ
jgi:two-component sensor histidine kinase